MWALVCLLVGLAIGFIAGWLVRDHLASGRRLIAPGERFGLGVPSHWHEEQSGE